MIENLNDIYTFVNFVVGPSNQMAYALCESISKNPAREYNPLFIYGDSGLGKTHLLYAIGNKVIKNNKKPLYVTSEEFMNDFIQNLKNKTPNSFREKYRNCDYLLIDDIQFLSGKEQTQEEFFHTFNELHMNGKQIVLTSDQPPKKIAGFEKRLKSRFEWGIQVGIVYPELETKIAIVKKKCEINEVKLNDEIINYIATNLGENIREIEGAITKIHAFSKLLKQKITLDFVKETLRGHIAEEKKRVNIEDIVKVVSKELNVKPSDMKANNKSKAVVEARRISIYLAKELIEDNSTLSLARFFNMKDHSSISKNIKKMRELLEDDNFRVKVENIRGMVLKGV